MPTVPLYERNVQLRPANQQGFNVQASPDAFGASTGRGMSQAAQGMSQAAQAILQVQQLEDATRAKEADNEFAAWVRERQYGENGFMTLQGRTAVDARTAFEQEVAQKRVEFGGDLPPGAQDAYTQASQARLDQILQQSIVHTANARKTWMDEASQARMDTFANDALVAYQNPAIVDRAIAAGQAEMRQRAELFGWDAETLANRELEYISGVRKGIAQRIAQHDPLAAERYVDEYRDQLTANDQFALDDEFRGPALQANADQLAQDILTGAPPEATRPVEIGVSGGDGAPVDLGSVPGMGSTPPANSRGEFNYADVARSMVGMTEGANAGAISDFIKRFAGIEIDPRQTAWCAAFVNAVLGVDGIEGTGKLNARSFLNFGAPVDQPQRGDVVVFSRGDPNGWQGHVGFFEGYDANGNIRVLGGNQSNSVSVATYSSDRLLGFRRPTPGGGSDHVPLTHSVAGLQHIEAQLAQIDDPRLREATRQQIARTVEAQEKAMRAERDAVQGHVENWMLSNPGASPDGLPTEIQQTLGVSGMTTLWSWHDKVTARGQPETDDHILYELQTMYATDPDSFSQMDLFQFRDRLSDSDWQKVTGWRQSALTGSREAQQEGLNLTAAWSQATQALEAVGLTTSGVRAGSDNERALNSRIAQFNNALADEMRAFQESSGSPPSQSDVQSMINRLLLPVVMTETSMGFLGFGTSERQIRGAGGLVNTFVFDARTRNDMTDVELSIDYDAIPHDLRMAIGMDLQLELGRTPDRDEVVERYKQFILDY